jgi:hypothetical protein
MWANSSMLATAEKAAGVNSSMYIAEDQRRFKAD